MQGLTDGSRLGAEGRRLDALRVDALEERFDAALELGEHREVVTGLRAALDEDPYRERLWGQLMLALYRSGRQADALDAFHEARRALADGLGLEPGSELRSVQEAILAQDPAITATPVAPPRRGNLPAPSTSFVGREAERAQVAALLGEHRIVTLTGSPFVEIVRYAKEQDIDLIVMGTHGRGPIAHMLMGSVAEKVVRKAPCPVLTLTVPRALPPAAPRRQPSRTVQ